MTTLTPVELHTIKPFDIDRNSFYDYLHDEIVSEIIERTNGYAQSVDGKIKYNLCYGETSIYLLDVGFNGFIRTKDGTYCCFLFQKEGKYTTNLVGVRDGADKLRYQDEEVKIIIYLCVTQAIVLGRNYIKGVEKNNAFGEIFDAFKEQNGIKSDLYFYELPYAEEPKDNYTYIGSYQNIKLYCDLEKLLSN